MSRRASLTRPDAVLLDVMGTLVHDPFHVELPAFFGLGFDELLAAKHPTAWVEFETGAIDEATFLRRFFSDGRPVDGPALHAHLSAAYRWLPGVPELLDDLVAAGVSLHVLSNYPTWYHLIEDALGLSHWVPWSFVSCERGVRKPDAGAFLGPLTELGLAPEQVCFVDDQARNIDAALALGLDAVRFAGVGPLRRDLVARGVLAP